MVERQTSAFMFQNSWVFLEKERMGRTGVFNYHLTKCLFHREEKDNANTGNIPVPGLRKPSESLTH